jgi:hypothetical protein
MNDGVATLFRSSKDDERLKGDTDEPDQVWYYDQKAGMSNTHWDSSSEFENREEDEDKDYEEEEEVDQREGDNAHDHERKNSEDICSQDDAEDSVFRTVRRPKVPLVREELIRVKITSSPLLGNPENDEDIVDIIEVSLKNEPSIDERLLDSSFTSKQDRYAELVESNTSIDTNSVVGIPLEVKFPWQSYDIKPSSSVSSAISSLAFAVNRSFGASIR